MRRGTALAGVAAIGALTACSSLGIFGGGTRDSGDYAFVKARRGDTAASLAEEYLGDRRLGWLIEDVNGVDAVSVGDLLAIPQSRNPAAVAPRDPMQKVSILAYHRFTDGPYRGDRLQLAAADFERQIAYMHEQGYRFVTMRMVGAYLEDGAPLPRRAVAVTIDDGYKSVYDVAFPILQKFDAPATVYVYSDFVGGGAALTWSQMRDMLDSGLIDIQPHSKSHANLAMRTPDETESEYRARLAEEFTAPARLFRKKLSVDAHSFAYPYGAVDADVAKAAARAGYTTAVTILRGANPSYTDPFALRRSMVYGDADLNDFKRLLAAAKS